MQYPLNLSFKVLAFAPQLSVEDASGRTVMYVQQKLFKLKEAVTVYEDPEKTRTVARIDADRVLDFSARYSFTGSDESGLGAVRRQGMRSLWRARYDVLEGDTPRFSIQEDNAWVKVADGLLGHVPVVGVLSNYLLHPSYSVTRPAGDVVMRLTKLPALFEGRFEIHREVTLEQSAEMQILLSLLMMVLLERSRG